MAIIKTKKGETIYTLLDTSVYGEGYWFALVFDNKTITRLSLDEILDKYSFL